MIRGVLFDIGNTLLTSLENDEINQMILKEKGIKKTKKQIQTAIKKAAKAFEKRHSGRKLLAMELDEFYIEWDAEVYKALGLKDAKKLGRYAHERWFDVAELRAYDDSLPVLNRLSAMGLRLGAVTNGYYEEAREVLGRVDIPLDLFSVIVGRDTTMAIKPDPKPFIHAAGSLGLTPDEMLYVGDRFDKDYEGARGAGMRPLLLLRGSKSLPPETTEEVTTIKTLDEVLGFIR
jgi:putative hydrolase of the HAD superfamily